MRKYYLITHRQRQSARSAVGGPPEGLLCEGMSMRIGMDLSHVWPISKCDLLYFLILIKFCKLGYSLTDYSRGGGQEGDDYLFRMPLE